jgi:uncharacterized protein YijF (DUF1287 family)
LTPRKYQARIVYDLSYQMEVQDDLDPGDLIWWKLEGEEGINHIGIVKDRGMVMHNIERGRWLTFDQMTSTYIVFIDFLDRDLF